MVYRCGADGVPVFVKAALQAMMSLLHSARINGHEPYAYLRNVLERLPTHPASRIDKLPPHRWDAGS